MKSYYIIKTTSDMFRAKEGSPFPWTRNEENAMQFRTARKADAERRAYAGFLCRPVDDYEVIEVKVFEDGTIGYR